MTQLNYPINSLAPRLKTMYIVLSLLVLFAFGNTLQNEYNMDDDLVTQNHKYTSKGFAGIKDIITNSYYSNNSDIVFGYRPITHITFAIEHQLFGERPFISHFINLILYLISVCLFFRLLLSWFGSEHYWIPIIAASIFAVHPIHTEVVASIKNRDEILAFLFAMISGIGLYSFSKHTSWKQLALFLVFFPIALLAKKSVYPLVIVFPLVTYLVNPSRVKNTIIACIGLTIPASFIVADFILSQWIIIFSLTNITFFGIYVILYLFKHPEHLNRLLIILKSRTTLHISAILLFLFGIYLNEVVLLFIALLLTIFGSIQQSYIVSYLLLIFNAILSWYYMDDGAAAVILIHAAYVGFQLYTTKLKEWKSIISVVFSLLIFLFIKGGGAALLILAQIFIFFILTHKKPIFGLLVAILSISVSFFFFSIPIYQVILLLISILYLAQSYLNKLRPHFFNHIIVVLFALSPLLISSFNQKTNSSIIHSTISAFEPTEINLAKTTITENNKPKKIKEGRALNYIENTLIAEHTTIEKIATGLVTLGEYLKLMIFPYELSFYYGYAKIQTAHINDLSVWIALLLHILLLVLLVKFGHKQKAIYIGLLWYLTCIFLFSNYIELVAGMIGERLAFTASAGFCVFFAALFISIKPQLNFKKPTFIEYIVIAIVFVFGSKSIARNFEWKDPITLMQSDSKHLENSAQANHLLALNLLYTAGKSNSPQTSLAYTEKAKLHLEKSIAIYPYFFNTHYELAKVYINESNWMKAKQKLTDALALDTANLFVLESLSKVCFELNQVQETEKYANQFISYVPQNENIHEILAYILFTDKQYEKAEKYAKRGLIYFPSGANLLPLLKDIEQKLSDQRELKSE